MNFPYLTTVRTTIDAKVLATVWVSNDTHMVCIECGLWTTFLLPENAIAVARRLIEQAQTMPRNIFVTINGWCRSFDSADAASLATALLNASTVAQGIARAAA